jgi:hypothetical protein
MPFTSCTSESRSVWFRVPFAPSVAKDTAWVSEVTTELRVESASCNESCKVEILLR